MTALGQRRVSRRRATHRFTPIVAGAVRLFAVLVMAAAWLLLAPVGRAVAAGGLFVGPLPRLLTVLHAFSLPAEPWLPGNRGVDLAASVGEPVVAAAAGTVLYAGALAGRGVISIDHGAVRTTYEPVDPVVHVGEVVAQGQLIGRVAGVADACGPPGSCLHWGAITAHGYVDPVTFLGRPTIRLLPIWGGGLPDAAPNDTRMPPLQRAVVAEPQSAATVAQPAETTHASPRRVVAAPVSGAAVSTTAVAASALGATALAGGALTLRRRRRAPP